MDTTYQVILALLLLFGVAVVLQLYLDGRFSHKHDYHVIDVQTVTRQPDSFVEISIPIARKVYIQQCGSCGKMKRHTMDVC